MWGHLWNTFEPAPHRTEKSRHFGTNIGASVELRSKSGPILDPGPPEADRHIYTWSTTGTVGRRYRSR